MVHPGFIPWVCTHNIYVHMIKVYLDPPRLQKRDLAAEASVTNITRAVSLRKRLAEVKFHKKYT